MTSEPICDRARRLAREAEAAALVERTKEQRTFLQTILGECDLDEIPYDEKTKTYLICGWRWTIYEGMRYELGIAQHTANVYRGMLVGRYLGVNSAASLGKALIAIDKEVAYRDRFPATLWGAIRWWLTGNK